MADNDRTPNQSRRDDTFGGSGLHYIPPADTRSLPDWTAEPDVIFSRAGDDLIIVSPTGQVLVIGEFFSADGRRELSTASGAVVEIVLQTEADEGPRVVAEIENIPGEQEAGLLAAAEEASSLAKWRLGNPGPACRRQGVCRCLGGRGDRK